MDQLATRPGEPLTYLPGATGPPPGQGREIFTITLFITLRRVQISQICMRHNQYRPPSRPRRTTGLRAFSRTAPVTQRHIGDRRQFEAGLRSGAGRTGLLEARWLAGEVPSGSIELRQMHIMQELAHDVRRFPTQDESVQVIRALRL